MRIPTRTPKAGRFAPSGLALALAATVLCGAHAAHPTATHLPASQPAASTLTSSLTASRASARAKATGQSVVADAMTTATSQTTANPDGSFTLTTSPTPVRVRKAGAWVGLDATLIANSDGTYSPTASTGRLVLSGGGNGPFATLTLGGRQLSLTVPATLPAPTISGPSATYSSVLPDTDLVVTATAQGGYSDVFVVKSAAAAANPALSTLMTANVTSSGLNLSTDAAGSLTATDTGGAPVFTAPAAAMWDSATTASASTATAPKAGTASTPTPTPTPTSSSGGVDPVSGAPLTSSVAGPGEHAHTASLDASYASGTLTLNPPASLLTGPTTSYPVYLDPSVGPSVSAWTMVNSAFPDQSYYGVGTSGHMQVGYNGNLEGCSPCFVARSFTALNLSGVPSGAVVSSAQVNFWEDVAPSCSTREVDLYATGPIYPGPNPPKTTWNNQPGWGPQLGSATVAKGYTGCSAGGVGFDISDEVRTFLAGGGQTLTLGLRATTAGESDDYTWKQFNGHVPGETATNASVTYDLYPDTPASLYTSPTTTCDGSTLGDTGVTLYAPVSTRTGANLTTTFDLYKATDGTKTNLLTSSNNIPSDTTSGPSGQPAVMPLPESFFKTQAGGTATSFTWLAQTFDGTLTSRWSNTCTFAWDPTRPGAPGVTPSANPPSGSHACPLVPTTATYPVGTTCAFDLTPPNGATISGYTYQLNDAPPITVSPNPVNANGSHTITITLPSIVNTLTVSALSVGGNTGSSTTAWFDGTNLTPPAKDGDLTNDGTPDLIIPGQPGTAFPPGLWLSPGHGDGTTTPSAINIGTAGLWSTTPTATSPAEWNGTQTITGNFCGNGAQDVLAYFPGAYNATSNPHGGGGAILCSNGTPTPLDVNDPVHNTQYDISAATMADSAGNGATQIANAGNTTGAGTGNPDLLATINNQLYLFATGSPGGYLNDYVANTTPQCTQSCDDLTATPTPDTSYDWNSWTITTTQLSTGTAAFLWNHSTGDLYLWTGLNATSFPQATTLAYAHQYQIASGWNTGKTLSLRAADINADGSPDLWATDPATGITTAYLLPTTLGNTTQLPASASTTLSTSSHAWLFQDIRTNTSGSALSTTADSAGTLNLSGTTGAVWNTGDLNSPDALLNTNSDGSANTGGTGVLTGPGSAVTVSGDFSVSVRAKPTVLGGVILSQDGTHTSGFALYPDGSGKWYFCLAKTDSTGWNYDCASGGTVQLGVWTQVTATYNHATGIMTLYVNGVDVAVASHTPVTGFTGHFHVGNYLNNNAPSAYYAGQVADIHTWNQVAPPVQPQTAGSDFAPLTPTRLLDTRNGTGGTTGPIGPGTTVPLQITGAGGIPATGVSAVALSITATAAAGSGILTVYPDGTAQPVTSTVNYTTNTTVTNSAIVPLGANGKIDITNSATTAQIIADATGYFTTSTTGASTYTPLSPVRALDTRNGTGAPKAQIPASTNLTLTIAGANTIPATGVTAVAINLTAADEAAGGYLVAYPDGATRPNTTTLTFPAGAATAAASIVPVGADGKIDIYNNSIGNTDLIGDIVGYFTTATTGQKYHPLDSTRMLDTRMLTNGILTTGSTTTETQNVVSAVNPTLVVNLTTTQQSGNGLLILYPGNLPTAPNTSSLDYAHLDLANLDLAQTSNNTYVIANNNANTHLIIDTDGYFANY